jgi:hypothetical protein
MRWPKPRFTVRRMMVAVAIVGLLVAGLLEIPKRRARFLRIAESHTSWDRD